MAQDLFRMGTGLEVGTDKAGVTVSGKSYNIHRQQVVVVQPADAAQIGHPVGQVLLRSEVTAAGFDQGNLNRNGSPGTPVLASYAPGAQAVLIGALVLTIRDSGAWSSQTFGVQTALTSGLLLEVLDASANIVATLCNLQKNQHVAQVAESVAFPWPDLMLATINLASLGASPYLPAGYSLRATIRDNLQAIEDVRIGVRGRLI